MRRILLVAAGSRDAISHLLAARNPFSLVGERYDQMGFVVTFDSPGPKQSLRLKPLQDFADLCRAAVEPDFFQAGADSTIAAMPAESVVQEYAQDLQRLFLFPDVCERIDLVRRLRAAAGWH